MDFEFEVYRRSVRARPRDLAVTIYRSGMLGFSRAAHEALGSPKSVDVLFVPGRRVFGIRASSGNDSYAVTESRNVSSRSFLLENNLIPDVPSIQISAYMRDDILVFIPD